MERKQLEDLIQRLWDQGASLEIMNILEHDKQQREKILLLTSQRDHNLYSARLMTEATEEAQDRLEQAVAILRKLNDDRFFEDYSEVEEFLVKVGKEGF